MCDLYNGFFSQQGYTLTLKKTLFPEGYWFFGWGYWFNHWVICIFLDLLVYPRVCK